MFTRVLWRHKQVGTKVLEPLERKGGAYDARPAPRVCAPANPRLHGALEHSHAFVAVDTGQRAAAVANLGVDDQEYHRWKRNHRLPARLSPKDPVFDLGEILFNCIVVRRRVRWDNVFVEHNVCGRLERVAVHTVAVVIGIFLSVSVAHSLETDPTENQKEKKKYAKESRGVNEAFVCII